MNITRAMIQTLKEIGNKRAWWQWTALGLYVLLGAFLYKFLSGDIGVGYLISAALLLFLITIE